MNEEVKKQLEEEFGLKTYVLSKGETSLDSDLSLAIAKGDEIHLKLDNSTVVVIKLDDRTVDFMQNLRLEDLDGLKRFNELIKLCFKLID